MHGLKKFAFIFFTFERTVEILGIGRQLLKYALRFQLNIDCFLVFDVILFKNILARLTEVLI